MQVQAGQKQAWTAKIIRANGKVEDLGTISGGSWLQKVVSYFRIKIANFKQKHGNG